MSNLQITKPADNAEFVTNKPVTFTGKADPGIATVELKADDQWPLGSAQVDAKGFWSITYSGFNQAGKRKITAIGFDQGNQKQGETSIYIYIAVSTEGIDKIIQVAANSQIAHHKWWKGQGVAPLGYIKGMALVYARVYCKLKAGDAAAKEMAKANTGDSNKDVLAFYAQEFNRAGMSNNTAGVDTLRHLFVLLMGLGMPESSGRYCEEWDRHGNPHPTHDTAEAGLFQTSYNASYKQPLMLQLFKQYSANPSGFLEIFKEGVKCSSEDFENISPNPGEEFQRLSKACPAFTAEFTAVGLRNLRQHWGTIRDKKVEICPDADVMLLEVQEVVDQFNLCLWF